MGNNRSRVAPARRFGMIDSHTRAQSQNQRELIQLRRKLVNINIKHSEAMARLASNRHDAKVTLHELQHETKQRQLLKSRDKRNLASSTSFINESDVSDENDVSTFECPSLLLHNLNASNLWEKSIILSNIQHDTSNQTKSFGTYETFPSNYSSKFDTSHNSFEQSESFILNDNLSLKQHTERMKKSIQIAIAKSVRDSKNAARRNTHKY